jgi:two-component system cell cycle sensor histidine kinase/response regulator CckA
LLAPRQPEWKRVETAEGFKAALVKDLDLIFSDFSMPQFSVERGLAILKKSNFNIPFIIVSGTIGEEFAVESLKAGATDYLLKDRLERLAPVVRRALRESRERKKREESDLRFRQLAENIHEVFWMTDVDKAEMLYISPGYERVWGRTTESLLKNPTAWLEAIHPEDQARVIAAATTKQVQGNYDEIYRIVRPDGTVRWIRDKAYPIQDEDGRVFRVAGTAEDITGQRNMESQLRQAQKMEAIGTLAGGIAHDFNNILGAIMGYTELARLEMEEKENSESAEHLNEVSKAANRAKELVRQILTFSRQQEQERIPLQLRHIVGEALKLLRAAIPSTIQFKTELALNTPITLADATQIHQIIMNLGTNAAHAMRPGGGRLAVSLKRETIDATKARENPDLKEGLYAVLTISDTGHGMDRATLQRIFDPFFTTKPPGEGTGLGLAVVHGIMKTHSGAIEVSSDPGKGTSFQLYFPAALEGDEAVENGDEDIPTGKGERILYVDDEVSLGHMAVKMLEKAGFDGSAMSSPTDALDQLQANPNDFDLVIMDLTMPGMNGLELAARIQDICPKLAMALTTGNNSLVPPKTLAAVGIKEVLVKPFTLRSLAEAVRHALDD